MAGKRRAGCDLTHDNWDQEDQPEEKGIFAKANDDILKGRIIKTARRRNPIRESSNEETDKPSVFQGFTGFSNKPAGDFSFLNKVHHPGVESQTVNGTTKTAAFNTSIFGAPVVTNTLTTTTNKSTLFSSAIPSSAVPSSDGKSETYCSKLKGLNESVSKWIVKKVEENPLISLQPIFKDYEKYLDDIEKCESKPTASTSQPAVVPTFIFNPIDDNKKESPLKAAPTFNFKPVEDKTKKESPLKTVPTFNFNTANDKNTKATPATQENKETTPKFSFGVPNTNMVSSTTSPFSFGSAAQKTGSDPKPFSFGSTSASTTSKFSFGNGGTSTVSFGNVPKPDSSKINDNGNSNEEEADDEPPKVEFKTVVENDYLYTIRCKVFVKKGDNFGDRGVGNLYLKPIESSEKVQLIVRADTNLGNLLLNFILSENVPTKRLGKKDVMMVTIPTPDSAPPPVPVLIRVRSPEEADNLLAELEKRKK